MDTATLTPAQRAWQTRKARQESTAVAVAQEREDYRDTCLTCGRKRNPNRFPPMSEQLPRTPAQFPQCDECLPATKRAMARTAGRGGK